MKNLAPNGPSTLLDLRAVLSKRQFISVISATLSRAFVNLLDVLALTLFAVFASSLSGLSIGGEALTFRVGPAELMLSSELDYIWFVFFLVSLFVVKSALSFLLRWKTSAVVAQIEAGLARRIFRHFFGHGSIEDSYRERLSTKQNMILQGTQGLSLFINSQITLIGEAVLLAFIVTFLLVVNPAVAGSAIVLIGIFATGMAIVLPKKTHKNSLVGYQAAQSSMMHVAEFSSNLRSIISAGRYPVWEERIYRTRVEGAFAWAKNYTLSSAPRLVIESGLLVTVFVLVGIVVLFSSIEEETSLILIFVAAGFRLTALLVPLVSSLNQMRDGAAKSSEVFSLLHASELTEHSRQKTNSQSGSQSKGKSLELMGVSFNRGDLRLSNLELVVEAGSKIALIGPSGGGKSTILDIMSGFLLPNFGQARIGGENARDVLLSQPGAIGFVGQSPQLISGKFFENISLTTRDNTDHEQVVKSLILAGLGNFTETESLEKTITSGSESNLSGGQIQRVALARALYTNPSVIFLDEPTSSLDPIAESAVMTAIEKISKDTTVVMVAHKPELVANFDCIFEVKEGKIRLVERGGTLE